MSFSRLSSHAGPALFFRSDHALLCRLITSWAGGLPQRDFSSKNNGLCRTSRSYDIVDVPRFSESRVAFGHAVSTFVGHDHLFCRHVGGSRRLAMSAAQPLPAGVGRTARQPSLNQAGRMFPNSNSSIGPSHGAVRHLVYFRRKGWLLWRRNLYRGRRKRLVRFRFLASKGRMNPRERSEELPKIKADELEWVFRFKRLPLALKSLTHIAYLLQGKHIQDAIDWLCAIPRCRVNLIYVELVKARQQIMMEFGGDPARLYISMVQGQYHRPLRTIRPVRAARFNRLRHYRNWLIVRIKQVSLENFFDRLYIRQKVPRSMASDMRISLREQRAPCYMLEEWQPYLSALSRRKHRQELNWKDRTRSFDYKATRDAWIANYQRCLLDRENDLRRQRGLQSLSPSSQPASSDSPNSSSTAASTTQANA